MVVTSTKENNIMGKNIRRDLLTKLRTRFVVVKEVRRKRRRRRRNMERVIYMAMIAAAAVTVIRS
jgi:cell division protein FtsL